MAAMSPQARRRLAAAIHGQEVEDLADDIVSALAEAEPNGLFPRWPVAARRVIVKLIEEGREV